MKKTLLIDIDDTLINSFELPIVNQFLGTNYGEEDFKSYIQEIFTDPSEMERFHEFLFTQKVYGDDTIKVKDDAIRVVKKLSKAYSVYLCSDYTFWQKPWESDRFFVEKFHFLKRHFNFISPLQHIFLKEKQLLQADIMIDDRIENFGENIRQRILFSAYHNKTISSDELRDRGIIRVDTWSDIESLLLDGKKRGDN